MNRVTRATSAKRLQRKGDPPFVRACVSANSGAKRGSRSGVQRRTGKEKECGGRWEEEEVMIRRVARQGCSGTRDIEKAQREHR